MPSLIAVNDVRERFDIDDDIDDRRLDPHVGSASRRLRTWVTDAVYSQTLLDAANGATGDQDRVADLRNAEAHLAFHFAILGLNSPLSSKGVVNQSRTSEGGREIRTYLKPDETASLAGQLLELAREIAGPYLAASDDSGIVVIEGSADTLVCNGGEAATRPWGDRCRL